MNTPIIFNLSIGGKKPHSSTQKICPFCHPETLMNILDKKDDIIWLMNKFPVFEGTYPTVIVETSDHNAELTTYSKEKLHEVISFGLERWEKMERDKRFKSVLYFRNYGPGSGGSQRHPHSQSSVLIRMTTRTISTGKISLVPSFTKTRTAMLLYQTIRSAAWEK